MADIPAVTSLVKPAMEAVGRFVVVKIKHLFIYLCFFNDNIQSLNDEARKLEDARAGLQRRVEVDENNARVILPEVKTWLENATNKIQVDKSGIDDQIPTLKNGCWGVKSRFRLSRKAVKLTGEMKQLMEERNRITDISMPPPPAAQVPISLGITYHEFRSRQQIEEDIVQALRAKEFRKIGICGMGGVGKTTMTKRIMNRAREENMFDEIPMVVVSQQVDILKIQGAIAESLGLQLEEETLLGRATKLRKRLTCEKRILIVFDDVWENLKLEDLGIPCGNERCTILFTSRNKDVVERMGAQKIYVVEILSDEEAWSLFRETTGSCVEDPNLFTIAKNVVTECKGLPIALVTVGGASKNKTSITFWEDALQQLKSVNPEDMPDFIKEVYNPLKLSYTKLESRGAKSLFLLCSLFPEDANISLEELTLYGMGLRMFPSLDFSDKSEGILNKVRRRVSTIVNTLKSHFLLLNGEDEHHARMHDVVRDVAIYIASHDAEEGIVDVKINSMRSPSEYAYQRVSVFSENTTNLLRMHVSNWQQKFEINDFSIFKGIEQLNVLSLKYIFLKSIPLDIQLINNLKTLRLESCQLESLSVVGELLSLEILYCASCYGIEELPVEIGNLNQLKLLDFTYCGGLKRIPPGVVSNLVELEEFKMLESFDGWELASAAAEVQGQERRNACLNEFENLCKLRCLEIEIKDANLAAEEIHFPPNIERYRIRIGDDGYMFNLSAAFDHFFMVDSGKAMYVRLPTDINLGSWVLRFLRSTDWLHIQGNGLKSLDLPQARNMKSLTMKDCCTDKELVNLSTKSIDELLCTPEVLFPTLERLELRHLKNLEAICSSPNLSVCFENNGSECHTIKFSKLTTLKFNRLESLTVFAKGIERLEFPMLEDMNISDCPDLKSFLSSNGNNQIPADHGHDDDACHLFCDQRISFGSLKSVSISIKGKSNIWCHQIPTSFFKQLENLKIYTCDSIRSLFSSSIAVNLVNLKILEVGCCERLEFPLLEDMNISGCPDLTSLLSSNGNNQTPIDLDHDDDTCHLFDQRISFGSLKSVSIGIEGKNNIWCHQIPTSFFKQLEKLEIYSCHSIRSLFSSSTAVNFVNLKKLEIRYCEEMEKLIDDNGKMVIESIIFPVLEDLVIRECPKLMSLISSAENAGNSADNQDDDAPHLFCNKTIPFGRLKRVSIDGNDKRNIWCSQIPMDFFSQLEELEIEYCNVIRTLFSSSISVNLVDLKKLKIWGCNEIVKVIEDNEETLLDEPRVLFPSLEELEFYNLPKLESFCSWRCDLQFPLLEQVKIDKCPLLEFFTMRSVTTPKLKTLRLDWNKKQVGDLNGAIKLHYEANLRRHMKRSPSLLSL